MEETFKTREELQHDRNYYLDLYGRYYRILVNGRTVEAASTIEEARDAIHSLPLEEGDRVLIRYSQVGTGGRSGKGWHEPNYEAYLRRGGETTLVWKRGRHKSYTPEWPED